MELELKDACLKVLELLKRKAKDRHAQLEEACTAATQKLGGWSQEEDPDKQQFPAEAVTYCYVITMDNVMGKKWSLKKDTRITLLSECVSGLTRLIEEGLITSDKKFDFLPGSATGVGKNLVAAVMETLVQHTPCKRHEVVVGIVKAIEAIVASNHYGAGTIMLEVVCQTLFRLHVCSASDVVQLEAKQALHNGLLSIQQHFEDLCHVYDTAAREALVAAALCAVGIGAAAVAPVSPSLSASIGVSGCSPQALFSPHLSPHFGPVGSRMPYAAPPSPIDEAAWGGSTRTSTSAATAAALNILAVALGAVAIAIDPSWGSGTSPTAGPYASSSPCTPLSPFCALKNVRAPWLLGRPSVRAVGASHAAIAGCLVAVLHAVAGSGVAYATGRRVHGGRLSLSQTQTLPLDADVISRSFQHALHAGGRGGMRSRTPHTGHSRTASGGGVQGWAPRESNGAARRSASALNRPKGHARAHSSGGAGYPWSIAAPWAAAGGGGALPPLALFPRAAAQHAACGAVVAVVAAAAVPLPQRASTSQLRCDLAIDEIFSSGPFASNSGTPKSPSVGSGFPWPPMSPSQGAAGGAGSGAAASMNQSAATGLGLSGTIGDDMNRMFQSACTIATVTSQDSNAHNQASNAGAGADEELENMLMAAWGEPCPPQVPIAAVDTPPAEPPLEFVSAPIDDAARCAVALAAGVAATVVSPVPSFFAGTMAATAATTASGGSAHPINNLGAVAAGNGSGGPNSGGATAAAATTAPAGGEVLVNEPAPYRQRRPPRIVGSITQGVLPAAPQPTAGKKATPLSTPTSASKRGGHFSTARGGVPLQPAHQQHKAAARSSSSPIVLQPMGTNSMPLIMSPIGDATPLGARSPRSGGFGTNGDFAADTFSERLESSPAPPLFPMAYDDDDYSERGSVLSQSVHSLRRWSMPNHMKMGSSSRVSTGASARNTPSKHVLRSAEHRPTSASPTPSLISLPATANAAGGGHHVLCGGYAHHEGEKENIPEQGLPGREEYAPVSQPGVTHRTQKDLLVDVRARPTEYDIYCLISTFAQLGIEDITHEQEVHAVRVQSRIYALELLVFFLSHVGGGFARALSLVSALKAHIARAVLVNLATTRPKHLFDLALQVLTKVALKVGRYMRAETAAIFVHVLLPICRSPMTSFSQRMQVVDAIASIFADQQALGELFLNHDSTSEGSDIVGETVATLSFVCSHTYVMAEVHTQHQGVVTSHRAAEALCTLVSTLHHWAGNKRGAAAAAPSEPPAAQFRAVYVNKRILRRLYKTWQTSSKKGVELLVSKKIVPDGNAATIAQYLFDNTVTLRLEPSQTGDLLLRNKPWNIRLLLEYMALFNMKSVPVDQALRGLLSQFRPMGEAQIMDRLMWAFVSEYARQNEHHTMVAPSGKFEKELKVMLHGPGFDVYTQDSHPLLAVVQSETETHVTVQLELRYHELPDDTDMVEAKACEKEQPVLTVDKQSCRKLDFIYFVGHTLLFINTQNANRNVKQCDKRTAQDYISIVMSHQECSLSAEAVEAIVKPVFDDSIALSPEYDKTNKYESAHAVQRAYEELKNKERDGVRLVRAGVSPSASKGVKAQHEQMLHVNMREREGLRARWCEMESALEISPEPMLASGLPLDKAIAKAYERGVRNLGRHAFEAARSGTHLKGVYVDKPTRREHVWLLFQSVWPAVRLAFDRLLGASTNLLLLRRISQCSRMASDMAAALSINPSTLHDDYAAVRTLHKRWAEYHRLAPMEPPQAHTVGVLQLLHNFNEA